MPIHSSHRRRGCASLRLLSHSSFLLLSASLIGCATRTTTTEKEPRETIPKEAGSPEAESSVYAMLTSVYDENNGYTTYVTVGAAIEEMDVSFKGAREFQGYSDMEVANKRLLIAASDEPRVASYEITDDLEWVDAAEVSFANYLSQGVGFYFQQFSDERTVYVTFETTSRIVWDAVDMEIIDVKDDSKLELQRDNMVLEPALSRAPWLPKGPAVRSFFYRDEDWFMFGPESYIATYDPETHEEANIIEAPCPNLETTSRDEDGNTYFSAWAYGPELSLFGMGPKLCVVRLKPDNTLDEEWHPDLTTWTGGREVGVFRYMANGKALGTVLQEEDLNIDFSAGYDEEAASLINGSDVWRLWMFDLEQETAEPLAGLGPSSRGFNWTVLDGRNFLLFNYDNWSRTKVYEIGVDGSVTELYDVPFIVQSWLKVR